MNIVSGTPRWAVWAAYGAILSVVPSAVWRSLTGFGLHLGTTQAWRDAQHLPGSGTVYVLSLSVLSIGAAALTLGLVQPWGERLPRWLGGLRVPTWFAVATATLGAACVILICAVSVARWEHIIGYEGLPAPGWYELVTAAYLPAVLWGPLLLAVTWAYRRRRTAQMPAAALMSALSESSLPAAEMRAASTPSSGFTGTTTSR
ncbi:hypothetical protein [Nocardioides sp. InS609-2]|uniref:hypothetical protein n=1 Tax=Nocardioides sp. InS609-2 TaxID=2760705 RepID=UPI0020BEF00C|nr:hypothetical protein [Nocardioides sp. InS609-2]